MPNPNPAIGERAATIGYSAQYRIAAELIYDALVAGKLEWIALTDPEAGRMDDILMATPGRIDAYQVKWGAQPGSLSFNELVHGKGDPGNTNSSGLIGQLAGGWHRLRATNPGHRVVVHLVTRDFCAPNAGIPHEEDTTSKANLHGFLTDCWNDRSWTNRGLAGVPTGWGSTIADLNTASNLAEPDFLAFIHDCELEFSYNIDERSGNSDRGALRRLEDVEALAAFLHRTIGADRRTIRLDRNELLARIGWEDRFRLRFQHDFPIDQCYRPITDTVQELEAALARYDRGYLALLGTPGSGKSTTLTHTLRYRRGCRVVRYYAFVRDSPFQGRGEASAFLHDLVLELQSQGISGGNSQAKTNEELLGKLSLQLAELHTRWLEDCIRTLILVDGLDHIEREQSPSRSLLLDLPQPDTVPAGVIFILGSQTLELNGLSPAIKAHLKQDGRNLEMRPLSRADTLSIISAASLPITPTLVQQEEVYRLSDGHPLALSYLLQQLRAVADTLSIATILESANPYQGHIDQTYDIYWQGIDQDESLRELLALLARLRVPFDPRKLEAWVGRPTVQSLVQRARIFFRTEIDSRWRFFHNSFRQFLIDRTSRDVLGERDVREDRRHHQRLAELCTHQSLNGALDWEALYHHACAEEWSAVTHLASQAYFRQQFYALRELGGIQEDIGLALRAARAQGDAVALFRLLLIEHELRERQDVLDQVDMPELVLKLHGVTAALDYAMDGSQLRIDRGAALGLCMKLVEMEEMGAARLLFDAAEPLAWLSGARPLEDSRDDTNLMKQWVRCAFHFRPLSAVLTAIDGLLVKPFHTPPEDDLLHATEHLRANMRSVLVDAISGQPDSALWNHFRELTAPLQDGADLALRLDFDICKQHPSNPEATSALGRIIAWAEQSKVDDTEKVLIAEYLLSIRGDAEAAARWIDGVPQPPAYRWSGGGGWKRLAPFSQRIRLNRLLAALGHPIDPVSAVPTADEPREQGNVLFERQVVNIASLWGKAKREEPLSPDEIIRALRPALHLFCRGWNETRDWHGWYELESAADDFFDFMVRAVAAHGQEAVRTLSDEMERQWTDDGTARYWPSSRRRKVSLALYRHGDERVRLVHRLESIQEEIGVWHEVHERVEELVQLAMAWAEIGELERARALIPRLLEGSFGIYHRKDRQLQNWVDLLAIAGANRPELIQEDVARFASAVLVLERAGRGRGTQDAATELLALATTIDPGYAWSLFDWLIGNGGLQFSNGVAGLLLGSLRTERPPIEAIFVVARHLYIPFTPDVYKPLATELAARTSKVLPPNSAERLLDELNQTIQIKAWPSDRTDWWRAMVAGLRLAGEISTRFETQLEIEPGNQDSASPSLILKDGRKVTEEEVMVLAGSFERLAALIDSVEKTEHFPWDHIVAPLLDVFSVAQVQRLLSLLEPLGITHSLRNKCALRLQQLGQTDMALAMLMPNLEGTSAHGWDRWMDGGSRLYAIKGLIAIDAEQWRPRALEMLIDDYLSEFRYPVNLLHNIEELADIFFPVVPWDHLWPEIREHVFQLAEFALADDHPPARPQATTTAEEVLLRSLAWTAERPISEMRDQTHNALCEFVTKGLAIAATREFIGDALKGVRMSSTQGLALLDTLWRQGSPFAREFQGALCDLRRSPDFIIRQMAESLADRLGIQDANPDDRHRELPTLYQLRLPRLRTREAAIPHGVVRAGEVFPDSSDPLEMIRPHDDELTWLSEITEIPFENLLERTVALMRSIQPEANWNRAAEKEMRKWHEDIGLKLTYNRSRPMVALRAISYVVAELSDADMLDAHQLKIAYSRLYLYEWRLAGRIPIQRPRLLRLPEKSKDLWYRKEWVYDRDEAFTYFVDGLDNGLVILGELSRFKAWEWEVPTEQRFAMFCHPEWAGMVKVGDAHNFFPYLSTWKAKDYPRLTHAESIPAMVVYGLPRQAILGVTEWLAFNPVLARHLGWQISETGLFRWVNKEGQTMVESRWWQDGPMHRQPPRSREMTGEGWLVVASSSALSIIHERVGDIAVLRAVKRSFKEEDQSGHVEEHSLVNSNWPARDSN